MTLLLLASTPGLGLRVVSTNPESSLPDKFSQLVVLNSSLYGLTDWTACLRVKTFHFSVDSSLDPHQTLLASGGLWLLSSYTALPCNRSRTCSDQTKQRLGNRWKQGRTLGCSRYGLEDRMDYYSSWIPGIWNSACISAGSEAGQGWFRVVLNDEVVFETEEYDGIYSRSGGNISLLNEIGIYGSHPSHGAVTDLHLWSPALSRQEVSHWSHCRGEEGLVGNIVNWHTADMVMTGLQSYELDKREVCLTQEEGKVYRAFNVSLTFPETVKFCRNLGGEVGLADSRENVKRMLAQHGETCPASSGLYSGYTDSDVEGDWRDVNTGAPLSWDNWESNSPTNFYNNDCGLLRLTSGLLYDDLCTEPGCPVCQLRFPPQRFVLRGLCPHLTADRFYFLPSQPQTEFLGFLNTKISFSPERRRWELVEMRGSQSMVGYMTEETDLQPFPLGLHPWIFPGNKCTDLNQTHRALSLHLDLEQPGHFCCHDGSCIDSEMVYDEFLDCKDRSDEENITYIIFPETYNKLWPPVNLVKGRKEILNIDMNFTVIDIFDINEEKAYFDISFLIRLAWFDGDLIFQYLKDSVGK